MLNFDDAESVRKVNAKFMACDMSAEKNSHMEVIFDNYPLYKQTHFVKASLLCIMTHRDN